MRFLLLCSNDLPMFTKEFDLVEHVFYLRHQDGFRQMYKSQGKDFWVRFVLSFRSAQSDVLNLMNGKVKDLSNYLDSFYIIIHEEFVEGPFSRAKLFFENIVTILLDENATSLYRFLSIVKSPFCRRETKHIYQKFFGNHGDPISFAKAIVMYPLFGRFAGALCICLRRWMQAKEMDDPSDTSYWVQPPAASGISPSAPDRPSATLEITVISDKSDKFVCMLLEDYLKLQLTMKSKLAKYCPCCQTRMVQKVASERISCQSIDGKSSAAAVDLDSKLPAKAKRMAKAERAPKAKKKPETWKIRRQMKVLCDDSDYSAEDDDLIESCCSSSKAHGDHIFRKNPRKSKKSVLEGYCVVMNKPKKFTAGKDINKDETARKKKKNRDRGQAKDRQKAKEDSSDIGSSVVNGDLAGAERPANCKTPKSKTFEVIEISFQKKSRRRCSDKVFNSRSRGSCVGDLGKKGADDGTETAGVPEKVAVEKTKNCTRLDGESCGDEASGFNEVSLERQMLGLRIVPQRNSDDNARSRHSRGSIKHSCTCCGLEEPVPKTFKKCRRCKDEGVVSPPFYCSRDCQIQDWNTHLQQYHAKKAIS